MKRFSLRYLLCEIALFGLALGAFRFVFSPQSEDVKDGPIVLIIFAGCVLFCTAFGGVFGRKGMFAGAIIGLTIAIEFVVLPFWNMPND